MFKYFDFELFHKLFRKGKASQRNFEFISLTAIEAYGIRRIYQNNYLKHILPPLNYTTIITAARIHARVYAALFSQPNQNILNAAIDVITHITSSGQINYNAVHIRRFEEECPCLFCRLTNVSHFSSREVPVDSPKWQILKKYDVYPKNCTVPGESKCWSDLEYSHPLCNMTSASLAEIINLGNRTHYPLYIVADNLHSAHTKQLIHGLGAFSWHNKELEHIRRSHGITS